MRGVSGHTNTLEAHMTEMIEWRRDDCGEMEHNGHGTHNGRSVGIMGEGTAYTGQYKEVIE